MVVERSARCLIALSCCSDTPLLWGWIVVGSKIDRAEYLVLRISSASSSSSMMIVRFVLSVDGVLDVASN